MKELQFVALRETQWARWESWLAATPGQNGRGLFSYFKRKKAEDQAGKAAVAMQSAVPAAPIPIEDLPEAFRSLCHDLALARDRNYSSPLIDRLQYIVLLAHQRIYGARRQSSGAVLRFFLHDFPRQVRAEKRAVLMAAALFFLPLIFILVLLQYHPDAVYVLLDSNTVSQMEGMYSPTAQHIGRPRDAGGDWQMLALYIFNNVRIDFQCFAGGMLFGLGSLFYLLYNALIIGSIAGHLTHLGYIETFWGFVAGHSGFELIGAVLSGAAGLKIGYTLIAPGRRTRAAALVEEGRDAIKLLYGAATFTFCAAFIEAYWSPIKVIPAPFKYAVGVTVWAVLLIYLLRAGAGGPRTAGGSRRA